MGTVGCTPGCRLHELHLQPKWMSSKDASQSTGFWLSGGSAILDSKGNILKVNEELAAWLGASPSDLNGLSLAQALGGRYPDLHDALNSLLERPSSFERLELASADGGQQLRIEACTHDSVRFLHLESLAPPLAELEEVFPEECWGRALGSQAFQRSLRSEAQVENLMHRWPGIIFSQRPDFSFAFVSPRIEEWTGVPVAEWRGQSRRFWEIVHEADAEAVMTRLRSTAKDCCDLSCTYRIRHTRTGRVKYLWEHRHALRSSNGLFLGFEGIWLDITRQTIAERRLLNMSWRDTLGTLTMGMAHDFCNIMTGITGLSETLELSPGLEPSARTSLGLIRSTAMQAGQLAHRIRQLHQGTPGERRYVDLNQAVNNLAGMLERVLPRRVRIRTDTAPGQLPIFVDTFELQQVVVNLALNASDAMENPGQVVIRTRRQEKPPVTGAIQGAMPRTPLVQLSIHDTGCGIPERHLGSIFDPFFTTKPLGKGSGLGLYNARLFAEKHGAAISVESQEGAGSTFHLWFPEADFTETQPASAPASLSRQTLLVMDTRGESLASTVQMLRQDGYYVQETTTPAAALDFLDAPDFQFCALLVLTHGDDPETLSVCEKIRARKGDLKILLCGVGCNQDELPVKLLQAVDALVPFDAPPRDFLARIHSAIKND